MQTTAKSIDPRVKRTRQLLQQAFMDLMGEKSFQSVTVQDIAERATVNRATFYAHFVDKYALLEACIREGFNQTLARRLPPSATLTRENLRLLILAVYDFLPMGHGHCSPAETQLEPHLETMVQKCIYEVLLQWLRLLPAPTSQSSVSSETIATVLSWGIFGAGVDWSQSEPQRPAEEMVDQVMAVTIGALARVRRINGLE